MHTVPWEVGTMKASRLQNKIKTISDAMVLLFFFRRTRTQYLCIRSILPTTINIYITACYNIFSI